MGVEPASVCVGGRGGAVCLFTLSNMNISEAIAPVAIYAFSEASFGFGFSDILQFFIYTSHSETSV